jgi:hypothetical protein
LLAQNIERKAVSRAIEELVVADDAFGLKSSISPFQLLQQVPTSAWRFKSNAQKVTAYRKWLDTQIQFILKRFMICPFTFQPLGQCLQYYLLLKD